MMDAMETIRECVEQAQNLLDEYQSPADSYIHAERFASGMAKIKYSLQDVYIQETGKDPWEKK